MKTKIVENVPVWAICNLAYGDRDGITDEEEEAIQKWLDLNNLNFLDTRGDTYFSPFPVIGLAAECTDALFEVVKKGRR